MNIDLDLFYQRIFYTLVTPNKRRAALSPKDAADIVAAFKGARNA